MDQRVLVAVARNESIPEDLIRELSHRSDEVQSALAYNRRTPFEVMVEMSSTNWAAGRNLADPSGRYAALVTPELLRQLARDPSLSGVLAKNPKTPEW